VLYSLCYGIAISTVFTWFVVNMPGGNISPWPHVRAMIVSSLVMESFVVYDLLIGRSAVAVAFSSSIVGYIIGSSVMLWLYFSDS
jgi:hypothetical protein